MKLKLNASRGQALIIIAFAIMGLVAMTGLAVDGGMVFSDRRHAQNAADTAALAGAMAQLQAMEDGLDTHAEYFPLVQLAALNLALQNGYMSDIDNATVSVYTCDMVTEMAADGVSCGSVYDYDPEYVLVIIESQVNTFFARVVGITELNNRVQAIALADDDDSGQLYGGDSIIALSPDCKDPGSFIVQGTADIDVTGGGLYINSDDPACGFKCDTNSGTISGEITTAGGEVDMSDHCKANLDGPEPATDGDPWSFPVTLEDVGLEVPEECSGAVDGTYRNLETGFDYNSGTSQTYAYYDAADDYPAVAGEVTVLTPGKYYSFPPKKVQATGALYDTIYMEPGVYCVEDVVKLIDRKLVLLGHNVTLFIRDGYTFDMNGGKIQIDAQDEGPYTNYLIILEPNYDGYPDSWTAPNCGITGNSLNFYEGAIFAPTCNVTINGADTSEDTDPDAVVGFDAQIIAYTLKINGNKNITFNYNNDDNPMIIDPPKTGLIK